MNVTVDRHGDAERTMRYERLVGPIERQVSRALVARYGFDVGSDAAADAIAWAWEHLDRLEGRTNPAGYLFRVGQSSARRRFRWRRPAPSFRVNQVAIERETFDIDLFDALTQVSDAQRVAVLMVHGFGFSYRDVADVLETTETAVTNHVHRGLAKVRQILGVES